MANLNQTLAYLASHWMPAFHTHIFEPGSLACVLTTSIKVSICQEVSQKLQHYPTLDGDGMAFWLCLTRIIFPNTQIFTSSIKIQI